jgi:hypothetical protein
MAVQSESFVSLLECATLLRELCFTVRPSHRTITMTRRSSKPPTMLYHSYSEAEDFENCPTLLCVTPAVYRPISSHDALPPGTFWELEKLSLDMKRLSDKLLDCLMKATHHLTTLSVDVRGMAWGPIPRSLGSHTTEVRRLLFDLAARRLTPRIFSLHCRPLWRSSCRSSYRVHWSTCTSGKICDGHASYRSSAERG